jgi:large subunit ribosomal protein L17
MRHLKKGRKFGREKDQRRALMKSLVSSFLMLGRIVTTEAKAKELRPFAEKLITRAKNPSLANRRLLNSVLSEKVTKKLVDLARNYSGRAGGYTRVIKLGARKSDSAKMAILELVK